jgi:hypothetical protein
MFVFEFDTLLMARSIDIYYVLNLITYSTSSLAVHDGYLFNFLSAPAALQHPVELSRDGAGCDRCA